PPLFITTRRPPAPALFPYTTLFRSRPGEAFSGAAGAGVLEPVGLGEGGRRGRLRSSRRRDAGAGGRIRLRQVNHGPGDPEADRRSEEHTSELQSPCNLVCRLLLEKK